MLVLKHMGVQPPARLGKPMLPRELLGMLGVTFDVYKLPIQLTMCALPHGVERPVKFHPNVIPAYSKASACRFTIS